MSQNYFFIIFGQAFSTMTLVVLSFAAHDLGVRILNGDCMFKVITKTLMDDESLWRYMDLSKYLSLLSDKSLWLARSDTFRDKREGVFHHAMRQDLDAIYHSLNKNNLSSGIKNTDDLQNYLSNNTYIVPVRKPISP